MDEFTSWPAHFREEIEGYDEPTLARMLAELDHKMMPFQTHAGPRAEFKSLMQGKKEGLWEFSRQDRSLGDVAHANIGAQARDDKNCEQFIDALFVVELQDQLFGGRFGVPRSGRCSGPSLGASQQDVKGQEQKEATFRESSRECT